MGSWTGHYVPLPFFWWEVKDSFSTGLPSLPFRLGWQLLFFFDVCRRTCLSVCPHPALESPVLFYEDLRLELGLTDFSCRAVSCTHYTQWDRGSLDKNRPFMRGTTGATTWGGEPGRGLSGASRDQIWPPSSFLETVSLREHFVCYPRFPRQCRQWRGLVLETGQCQETSVYFRFVRLFLLMFGRTTKRSLFKSFDPSSPGGFPWTVLF